jgi:hypothetical protein
MELRVFVKETLKDIVGGIQDAQNELGSGIIIPSLKEDTWSGIQSGLTSYQTISFEVSVNAVEKEGSEAKLNVVAAVIGGGIKGDSSTVSEHTAKLSFKVPVRYPKNQ